MSRNPYAPPAAPVNEVVVESPPPKRPWPVTWAVLLGMLSLAAGTPDLVLDILSEDPEQPVDELYPTLMFGFLALILGLIVFLLIMISRGHNWARIVYTVLAALGIVMAFFDLPASFQLAWYYGVLYLLTTLLDVATVILLFLPLSNAWFRLAGARRPA